MSPPAPDWPPEPPVVPPPGRVVGLPGRGEVFLRDGGPRDGDRPTLLLLHGWTVSADLNWLPVYDALIADGHRVVALDHRGHGRGLRTPQAFRLDDCADDAAALLAVLGIERAVAVGYSMGGAIAQLVAHRHRDRVVGLVLCATAQHWRERRLRLFWRSMGALRLVLSLAPLEVWRALLRASGAEGGPATTWAAAELSRGSGRDIAEAGRELARFDSRPWLHRDVDLPASVVVTTRDRSVPPRKQRELAAATRATTHEVADDHLAVSTSPAAFRAALRAALADVVGR